METSTIILHGFNEHSVLLHGSKEVRSRWNYFCKLVPKEKNIWQSFCFSTSTEQTAKLADLQTASHNKYTKLHLKTNTCNFKPKILVPNILRCSFNNHIQLLPLIECDMTICSPEAGNI